MRGGTVHPHKVRTSHAAMERKGKAGPHAVTLNPLLRSACRPHPTPPHHARPSPPPTRVRSGFIAGPFRAHCGSLPGPFRAHFGSLWGPFWVPFGPLSRTLAVQPHDPSTAL